MTKADFIGVLKTRLDEKFGDTIRITRKDADQILETVIDTLIEDVLKKDEKLQISGFGTFKTKRRKATTRYNPKTREPIEIPEHTVPVLKFTLKLDH